jgi:hypothetical protein
VTQALAGAIQWPFTGRRSGGAQADGDRGQAAGRGQPVGGDGEKGWSEPVASAELPANARPAGRRRILFPAGPRPRGVSQVRPNWEGSHLTPRSAPDTAQSITSAFHT